MYKIELENVRKIDGVDKLVDEVRERIQSKINLDKYTNNIQNVTINSSTLIKSCLLVGLSSTNPRNIREIEVLKTAPNSPHLLSAFNNKQLNGYFVTLIRMRYHDMDVDLSIAANLSRVVGYEIIRGCKILLEDGAMEDWFNYTPSGGMGGRQGLIPELNLHIGQYDNGIDAFVDINSRNIPNTQMVIAGSTGSGKTNLLVRLINQLRELSTDTSYPVNFLLFDYKGEFSDSTHSDWLDKMEISSSAVLDPIKQPLPFNPFVDMTGKTINEINLESSNLAAALIAIFGARVSATMDANLRSAINESYKETKGAPVSFDLILKHYRKLNDDKPDTVANSLRSMIDAHMFAQKDDIDLINNSFIINLGKYPKGKDNSLAKAIIYFTLQKLNSIYESLSVQESNDERVEIRHFTIIDEAHYMLNFNNQPLRNLVAVGRNKGMSVILASQDMSSFKTEHFDFYQNAYFPIIMRQQQVNDVIVSKLFGGDSKETKEVLQVISNLQLGEAIIKNNEFDLLGMGKRYKKIKVTKMI